MARNRIEIVLDAGLATHLTLGPRFLGDSIVKRRGGAPGIVILARNLDQGAPAIVAAIRRHWPPQPAAEPG
jgi:hypothetical protein